MKLPVCSSLLLSLGVCSSSFAIERPPSLDENLPKETPANRAVEVDEAAENNQIGEMPQVGVRPAWLGVFSDTADDTLSMQLGVEGGVVLRFVAEGSPAEAAGLRVHDLLTMIDDKAIGSQDELRAAVSEHKPGDEIKVGVVSRGVKAERVLKLGERPANLMQLQDDPRFQGGQHLIPGGRIEDMKRQMEELNRLFPDGDLQKRLEKQMKEVEQQFKDLEKMPGFKMERMEVELNDLLEKMPNKENGFKINPKMMGSVKLMDDQGSVEMKMRDGGQEVKVRDKVGNLLYEGPWDTDQDKAAVAPELRERIEKLNVGGNGKGGAFQLKIGPGGKIEGGKNLRLEFRGDGVPELKEDAAEDKDVEKPE